LVGSISQEDIQSILHADRNDPFQILGIHSAESARGVFVRLFYPDLHSAEVVDPDQSEQPWIMDRIHSEGFYEVFIPNRSFFRYLLRLTKNNGEIILTRDPYSFLPLLTDLDIYLFNEGTHLAIYEFLGAHFKTIDETPGMLFCVWAPNARRVSVVGDFNGWDGRIHQMRMIGSSGIWEIFIPNVPTETRYKFEIKTQEGHLLLKSDPLAFYAEKTPLTASLTYNLSGYNWRDHDWIEKRKSSSLLATPMSIYEVHLGSWKKGEYSSFLSYRELAHQLVDYVQEMGFTHIELLPICEHPFNGSWGYQATGYFAPTSRFGEPKDFMYFVDYCHKNGIGVILDWVIAHFPKDGHGLGRFDGTALYEHVDPRKGEHPHWGSYIFNYGRREVRCFLVSNAMYWLKEYHIDGLRVDAVASMLYLDYGRNQGEWLPNQYGGKENLEAIDLIRYFNESIYHRFPGIMTIAEESTAWPGVTLPPYTGGLGFLFKWNMGWMNDFLAYMSKDPIYRKYHHQNLTFPLMYAFSENFILPLSHDEVVHEKRSMINKMPGDWWQKFANLRLCYATMFGFPGKKLLFMGNEIGQWSEWDHDTGLNWFLLDYDTHRKLQLFVKDLNRIYKQEKSLWEIDNSWKGFEWIDCNDSDNSILSFIRKSRNSDDFLVFACNYTPVPRLGYRLGVPKKGVYQEVLNSDSEIYGGSNIGNFGQVFTQNIPGHGKPFSVDLNLPPLGCVVLKLSN
jgi:1,4-alpha-glucan branching enzyme